MIATITVEGMHIAMAPKENAVGIKTENLKYRYIQEASKIHNTYSFFSMQDVWSSVHYKR